MLEGKNIKFRPVEESDLDLLVRWRNDPNNMQFVFSPFLINPGGQKKWYADLLASPNRLLFMVENLQGKSVGMIGMSNIDWRNQEFEGGPIVFDPDERSHGYAEEAIEMLIRYAFEELNLHRMYAYCFPFNRIIELMKWFGFQEEGVLRQAVFRDGKFQDKVLLALLRQDWQHGSNDAITG